MFRLESEVRVVALLLGVAVVLDHLQPVVPPLLVQESIRGEKLDEQKTEIKQFTCGNEKAINLNILKRNLSHPRIIVGYSQKTYEAKYEVL